MQDTWSSASRLIRSETIYYRIWQSDSVVNTTEIFTTENDPFSVVGDLKKKGMIRTGTGRMLAEPVSSAKHRFHLLDFSRHPMGPIDHNRAHSSSSYGGSQTVDIEAVCFFLGVYGV